MGSIPGSVLPRGRDSVDRRRHLPPLLPHRLSRHRPGAECEYRHKVRASDPGQNRVNFQQIMYVCNQALILFNYLFFSCLINP